MDRPMVVLFLLGFLMLGLAHRADGQLVIGVYDQRAVGGQGASVDGLVRGLNRHGYKAEAFTSLQTLTLLQYDIVYLSDMHSPGNVGREWTQALKAFVNDGGSVLQTWHHHTLGEVGFGIQRIYGSRRMHVQPGHAAVAGVSDFDASFGDHIIERVGPAGTVILTNDAGQPVAVAGSLGKGKIISTGLALAIPNGNASAEPRGGELALLKAFLAWLTPSVPREERWTQALKTPSLVVAPSQMMTAAGFPASFEARVGFAQEAEAELACEGAEVTRKAVLQPAVAAGRVIVFDIIVSTESGKPTQREYAVRGKIGNQSLEQKFTLTSVYAKPPVGERRGVWLHVGQDRHPQKVMPELKSLGINMAVLRIAGGTAAFYASKVQPDIQDPLAPDGDWLAEAVKYARENGIEIHPYVNNCIVEGRTSPRSLQQLRAAGRLQEGPDGRPIDWFCPSQDINFEAMERPMVEIATRYAVDGVQYDFIRYPTASGCFCAKCRARFEQETGKPVAQWPKDVVDGPRKAEWVEYRCRRISALVERISTRLRKEAPKVKISAAVFAQWPECRESVGQDWPRWCKEGWLDFVCPMNYTLDLTEFARRAVAHRQAVPPGFPILQGIGIQSGQGAMKRPAQLATHIALARQNGVAGFIGFCYTPDHTSGLFSPLKDWLRTE